MGICRRSDRPVKETAGQAEKQLEGHERDEAAVKAVERELAAQRSAEAKAGDETTWSEYAATKQ